ncbi:uncharacterized protein LOC131685578 [Topomyia yanbarensis]|uniref:uncharacterized protein LOC131685578 n=1 Tax=Topomyia yanbarensis TaxID=2498891 RepID=UPI00273AFE4F|nr:uncharacterized protein LOC131685578 [Topomyia yanbarensis]
MDGDERVEPQTEHSDYSIEALDDVDISSFSGNDHENGDIEPQSKIQRMDVIDIQPPENESEREYNLSLNGVFFKRRFVGETSGSQVTARIMYGNTVNDILHHIWDVAKCFISREVIICEEQGSQQAAWAKAESSFEDLSKFVVLQDPQQKRRVNVDKLDSKALINWRHKVIRIHVHMYSTSVACKSLWDVVDKQLVRHQNADRAGAPSNQALTTLAEELRNKHGSCLTGHSSAWKLWANYIHTGPAHERDQRLSSLPPTYLLKFFRSVPVSEAVRMNSIRSGLNVANTINDSFAAELDELDSEVEQLISLGKRLKSRIQAMRLRCATKLSLVSSMQESIRPEEDELSRSLVSKISDMPDVDHL